jgi:hypothetical protein
VINMTTLIRDKIQIYKKQLVVINASLEHEMAKEHGKRRIKYIMFLAQERSVYSFAESEMEDVFRAMSEKPILEMADEKP